MSDLICSGCGEPTDEARLEDWGEKGWLCPGCVKLQERIGNGQDAIDNKAQQKLDESKER